MLDMRMRRRFAGELVERYPGYDELAIFLEGNVDRVLATISAPDALPLVVHRVLRAARAGGWLAELVEAAADDTAHSTVFQEVRASLRAAAPPSATELDLVVVLPTRWHALAEAVRADPRVGRVGRVPTAEADALVVGTDLTWSGGAATVPVVLVEPPGPDPGTGSRVAPDLAAAVTQIVVAGEPRETARRIVDHLAAVVPR